MTSSRVASAPVAWQRCLFDQWTRQREWERKGTIKGVKKRRWNKKEESIFPLAHFPFFPPSFFLRYYLYFYALLDSSPSARRHFNWTEQSSSFPSSFEGCQPCIPKNLPFVFETLVFPSCNAPFFPPLDLLHLLEDSRVLERGNFNICFGSEIVCARTPALCARVYRTTSTASLEILKVRWKYWFTDVGEIFHRK